MQRKCRAHGHSKTKLGCTRRLCVVNFRDFVVILIIVEAGGMTSCRIPEKTGVKSVAFIISQLAFTMTRKTVL